VSSYLIDSFMRLPAQALAHAPKVLLTATPPQNSLLELYGLVSMGAEDVKAKAEAGALWCRHASGNVKKTGAKPGNTC
jgi:hypothetical protein